MVSCVFKVSDFMSMVGFGRGTDKGTKKIGEALRAPLRAARASVMIAVLVWGQSTW